MGFLGRDTFPVLLTDVSLAIKMPGKWQNLIIYGMNGQISLVIEKLVFYFDLNNQDFLKKKF